MQSIPRTVDGTARYAGLLILWLILALALSVSPLRAETAQWAGKWDARWADGGSARLELRQNGAAVEGDYPLYGGTLTGTATGNRVEGTWSEGARHGRFVMVLGPFAAAFTGRINGDEWWSAVRTAVDEKRPEIRDGTPQDTLRSFLLAGNVAGAGYPDAMALAVGLTAFGPGDAALDARGRVGRVTALFRALDLTTFQPWNLPDPAPDASSITYALPQAGTNAVLPVNLERQSGNHWRIAAPDEGTLAAGYRALLVRDGGRPPAPDAMEGQRTPRDTMRKFIHGLETWDTGGAAEVLDTMDLSQIRPGYRVDHGELEAQYMLEVINRVGAWHFQEIPDDPTSRAPYVFFSHPAGAIVIAPQGAGDATRWRFTADSIDAQLRLFVVTDGMPPGWGMSVSEPDRGVFALRRRIAAIYPQMLARSVVPALENWQIAVFLISIVVGVIAVVLLVPLAIRGLAALAALLGQPFDDDLGRRLVWPLRLLVIALVWYRFRQRIGIAGPGLTIMDSAMGVVAAIGFAWAGLPLVDVVARGFRGRALRTVGNMDDILVSLTAGVAKLALVIAVAVVAAQSVDLPLGGMLAGLGIGGLAVAFAAKEALSNLFGAGILLADRPFRNGDSIAVGDVQGTVEHVGIRSTRIRTVDDTVVVLPNGKLSDALINNFGARRHRLFRTKFVVGYSTSPEQLDAFTSRLRELVDGHPNTAEDRTQVGLWELGDGGILIDIVCYLRATNATDERSSRHDLLLQVMRLAEEMGIRLDKS